MRRLPVYLLIDVSGSMNGEPIESVKNGLQMLVTALRKNPQALETAYLSIITFASEAKQIVPLSELTTFQIPDIYASGGTALGGALNLVCERRDEEVVKGTTAHTGDWLPMVFIMTDGIPTDDEVVDNAIEEFNKRKWGQTVSCAAGPGANKELLKRITPENVYELATADPVSLAAFFKWVTASIATASKSVNETGDSGNTLPDPPPEIKPAD